MSMQHPIIVYVGDLDTGRRLQKAVQPLRWNVYLPAEAHEALAVAALYPPDAVVIDYSARPTVAVEVYQHLRTLLDACPPIIAVTRSAAAPGWTDSQRFALPPTQEPARLIAAVRTVVEHDESIWE